MAWLSYLIHSEICLNVLGFHSCIKRSSLASSFLIYALYRACFIPLASASGTGIVRADMLAPNLRQKALSPSAFGIDETKGFS